MQRKLSELDLELVVPSAGTAFAAGLAGCCPSLLLAEQAPPEFDGLMVLANARATCPQLPVILVGDVLAEATVVEAVKAGAADSVSLVNARRLAQAVS